VEPIVLLVLVGAFGGIVRSLLGYQMQAPEGEKFNVLKMIKSMIRAAVAGAFLVYNTVEITPDIGAKLYLGAFFTSMGADVFLKEVYGTIAKGAKKTPKSSK